MTSRYSHGGHGWNQQLREAVTRLQSALLSYGLSYGKDDRDADLSKKVVNAAPDVENRWWSQRDLNPCFSHTAASPFFIARFADFVPLIHR